MHLKNFKGFRDTEIPEFRKVNLILGGQNVGKTSLLEAVVFVAGDAYSNNQPSSRSNLPSIFRPSEGHDASRFWRGLIGTKQKPLNIKVEASFGVDSYQMSGYLRNDDAPYRFGEKTNDQGDDLDSWEVDYSRFKEFETAPWFYGSSKLTPSIPQSGDIPEPFSAFPKKASEQVELYGRLVTGRKKYAITDLLKQIEPRLESIEAVAPDGENRVYVELAGHPVLLPLSQLGHGFTRLFELYSGLAVTDSKLALIDEIENGIHYSALPTVFQGIRELAESNGVQSIVTTHSLEAIKAACEVFEDKPEDFQLIRLERTKDDNIRAVAINDENLKTVMASGWEIR